MVATTMRQVPSARRSVYVIPNGANSSPVAFFHTPVAVTTFARLLDVSDRTQRRNPVRRDQERRFVEVPGNSFRVEGLKGLR
jgi:hypothetical protein